MFAKPKLLHLAAWSSDINFVATDEFAGTSGISISVNSTEWAALSVKYEGTFSDYAGLRFDIVPDLTVSIQSTGDNDASPNIVLSIVSNTIVDGDFSSLLINSWNLPGSGAVLGNDTWDRINFQAGANGAYYHIDNIVLVSEIAITPKFLSAEPLANNVLAVTTQGAVNLTDVHVALDGKAIKIIIQTTYVPVDTPAQTITYFTLASSFKSGNLSITAEDSSFSYVLPAVQRGTLTPHVYGVNFPTSARYIQHLGVTISRWGGNAVTAYNPFGDFTNAGNDWYFENSNSDDGSADDWVGWVKGAGSDVLLTVPALDWVSKDNTSYSYSASIYPDQELFDPYKSDAGDGLFPNGYYVTPVPDQTNVYTPWNTSLAKKWLSGLKNKPLMVAIDTKLRLLATLTRICIPFVDFSTAAKEALPEVLVIAPSTCSWWYYWTSQVGYSDNAAHNSMDFLPWFLAQMNKKHLSRGQRLLDYLDIHYYFQPDTSANDAAAKALRLRMTRSLWDPTYVDESWVGSNPQNHQPNGTIVNLIPRFEQLIQENYPGTLFSISEWSFTADTDLTGGFLTVDVLGIWGKYGVDSSTYWATLDETVNLDTPNPDTQGVYAATENGKLSLVIVNKNPDTPIAFNLAGVPAGKYFVLHFGGEVGVAKWHYIVIPAYTAVFLKQQ
ncbi:glycoside hydrolase family 44-domain-containing protein [Gymnopilus junonius]|uniref:Glycoside hydrolase family 44-domain-containing protein n=1 Tax=Gymnopilus junonius TaxID=109634 RepID=A0A9P5P1C0_GYMJU|nr:glycoside hydrolase family 44-domain-containing protein [Gymnopilus junonius]